MLFPEARLYPPPHRVFDPDNERIGPDPADSELNTKPAPNFP